MIDNFNMKLEIKKEQYAVIRRGLLELPAKESHELLNDLDIQFAKEMGVKIPEIKPEELVKNGR